MKTYCRLIAPKWLNEKPIEGFLSEDEIVNYNSIGYNVFVWPNHPKRYPTGHPVKGSDIDKFNYVFVDYDSKSNVYTSKNAFIEEVVNSGLLPTRINDSGNGIHIYWAVTDLDANSYLRLQRRLVRRFKTDEATCNLAQLMRLEGTLNTKNQDNYLLCETLYTDSASNFTCEQLDKALPSITLEDEAFCKMHYDKAYGLNQDNYQVNDTLPAKFGQLIATNHEAKDLWVGTTDDRSKSDYRLGHLMFAAGFTKEEAASVLVNSAKALNRAPVHRSSYATNIIDKIWTFELQPEASSLSQSVKDILQKSGSNLKGTSFRCHKRIDNTEHGFRLGQVIGLVAGSGVGKTTFSLNLFRWFIEQNPDYHHFFVSLEQPANEIADRWNTISQGDTSLNDKVHVISNYDVDGSFRHLSFHEIQQYLEKFQKDTGKKAGCVVIDHIGALKKKGSNDENQDLMTICHSMKAFAIQTNTLLVMQSQTSREKAGIGDLELNKDAAYGTTTFEWYCDHLITIWQPLKRCHPEEGCPQVTAFKFCKIRHKNKKDIIKEDVCYYFRFDGDTEQFKPMGVEDKTSFDYFLSKATNKRKQDRKTEIVEYVSTPFETDKIEIRKGMH